MGGGAPGPGRFEALGARSAIRDLPSAGSAAAPGRGGALEGLGPRGQLGQPRGASGGPRGVELSGGSQPGGVSWLREERNCEC